MTERTYTADEVDAMIARALAREREKPQSIEHCLWARNGNTPCPHVQPARPPEWWPAVENILNEYGLQAIDFVADFKHAMKNAEQPAQQEPVAIVDANDDGYWGEILPDRDVKVGQLLYTRPQAPEQPAIPQGWKLVPIEPTPEMMDAAHNVAGCLSYTEYRSVFRAMLNAAPTPQGEKK